MTVCSVKWCGNSSVNSNYTVNGITFHKFPRCSKTKEKWIKATHRREGWLPTQNSAVCSRHFTEDSFHMMKNRRRLMSSAIPTLFLPIVAPTPQPNNPKQHTSILRTVAITSDQPNDTETMEVTYIDMPQQENKQVQRNATTSAGILSNNVLEKKRLCRRIIELNNMMITKNKLLRESRDRCRRLIKKVASLKVALKETKESLLEIKEKLGEKNCQEE